MECSLCLGYHTDPVRISDCCHTFCRSCLEGVFVATKGQAKCPSCKAKLTRRGFVTAVDTAEVVEVVKKLVLALDPMCVTPPITQLLHEQNERGEHHRDADEEHHPAALLVDEEDGHHRRRQLGRADDHGRLVGEVAESRGSYGSRDWAQ